MSQRGFLSLSCGQGKKFMLIGAKTILEMGMNEEIAWDNT